MKRGLALLLTGIILLITASATVSAATFIDTEGENCEIAVEVLAALGIVEGKAEGTYEPESLLTRAEMTAIILRSMGMENKNAGRDIFTDVPANHWAYATISTAYQIGIVNGVSEIAFEPDKVVTYEQAVKMVVAALGYTVQAEAIGGYPSGYLSKAAQLDILKGVEKTEEMTRGNMAMLLYNALDVEMFVRTAFGEDTYDFEVNENQTILSHYLKVEKITDKITASSMLQFKNASHGRRLLTDEVAVGSRIMKKGETNAQDLIGVQSDIYIRTEDNSEIPVIVAIVPRAGVKVIDVSARCIDAGTSVSEFIYTDMEGKECKLSISGATLLYNGREETVDVSRLTPETGTVRLISEGGNVDLVVVWEYDNFVVENVISAEKEIYFKGKTTPEAIDFTDTMLPTVMTDKNGMDITLDSLVKGDILSVAKSLPHNASRARRIYHSKEKVIGKITEISQNEVVIGDVTYAVSPSMNINELSVGQDAAFYLDFTGAIASVDNNYAANRIYGWMKSAATTNGLNGKPQLKLFTEAGEWKVFDLAEIVRFNGQGRKRESLLDGASAEVNIWGEGVAPSLVKADGTVVPQLIAYKTNDAGVITEIETAYNKTNPRLKDEEKIGDDFSMDWYIDSSLRTALFDGTMDGLNTGNGTQKVGNVFLGRVFAAGATKMFVIPNDTESEKDYKISETRTITLEGYREMDCVSFYDVDEDYNLGVLVVRNDLTTAPTGGIVSYPDDEVASALVTGISIVLTEDGEARKAIKLLTGDAQEITAYVDEDGLKCLYTTANADIAQDPYWYIEQNGEKVYGKDVTLSTLKRTDKKNAPKMYMDIENLQQGDVVQYQMNSANVLTMLRVSYRANYPGGIAFSALLSGTQGYLGALSADNYYVGGGLNASGIVTKASESNLMVKVNLIKSGWGEKEGTAIYNFRKGGKYLLWDREKNESREITINDIHSGDEVFVVYSTNKQIVTIVYRDAKVTVGE
ncbi:MAG: S-layer homology domain-containing protein [Ruminococcaceae bacterium]|nr:S-layer homology domain-containing protein [Oscillospiraceae bacterium]